MVRRTKRPNYGPDESPNMNRRSPLVPPPATGRFTSTNITSVPSRLSPVPPTTNHPITSRGGVNGTLMRTNNHNRLHRSEIATDNPNNPIWLSPIVTAPAARTNVPSENRALVHIPTSNDNDSTEQSPERTLPRRSPRRRRCTRLVTCPYNLRSKRRRLDQDGQSSTTGPTAQIGQASTSVQPQAQATPRDTSDTIIVINSQTRDEQPQGARYDDSSQDSEEESGIVIDGTTDMSNDAERVEVTDAGQIEISDTGGIVVIHEEQIEGHGAAQSQTNDEGTPDPNHEEVIFVSHTRRGQALRGQASSSKRSKRKIVLERFRPFFSWRYKTNDPHCVICFEDLEEFCPKCQILEHRRFPADTDCKLVWGRCSHVFHDHCLQDWFKNENANHTCPLDRQVFEVHRTG